MKKILLTATMFAAASASVFAQNAQKSGTLTTAQAGAAAQPMQMSAEQRQQKTAEAQAKDIERQYGLSEGQYKGVYSACLEFVKTLEGSRTSKQALTRDAFGEMMAQRNAKIKAVMTPAQYAKFETTLPASSSQTATRK